MSAQKILVADDSRTIRALVRRPLIANGYDVILASDGVEAVQLARRENPDLVILDIQMPEMDGLEATAVIRARERQTCEHVPIIAMTAHAMKGDRERCMAAGMDDYVSKPVRPGILFDTIASVLRIAPLATERSES